MKSLLPILAAAVATLLSPALRAETYPSKPRRGRDASCLAPPAQTRTCSFPAYRYP